MLFMLGSTTAIAKPAATAASAALHPNARVRGQRVRSRDHAVLRAARLANALTGRAFGSRECYEEREGRQAEGEGSHRRRLGMGGAGRAQ
jgi:hypothetical protein